MRLQNTWKISRPVLCVSLVFSVQDAEMTSRIWLSWSSEMLGMSTGLGWLDGAGVEQEEGRDGIHMRRLSLVKQ